jgi:ATP-dependent Clp protease ATP-binding subunit ClpA
MQGLGVEAHDVKKALGRTTHWNVQLVKRNAKNPKDWSNRGTGLNITKRWNGSIWGPKNWYVERLQKVWPRILFNRKIMIEKRWARLRLPDRWKEPTVFWALFWRGAHPPVYKKLSERSKEVLRVAQMETFRAKVRGFKTLKVGTASLFLALTMVAEGPIVNVLDNLLWDAAVFTRRDVHGWFTDPFARLRLNTYLRDRIRVKYTGWTDRAGAARAYKTFLFAERFKGLGGVVKEWETDTDKFRRSYGYYLETCGQNLCAKFLEGKIDAVSGRDFEINQGLLTLARRFKNNPVYLGYPGVGKSALVEGTAALIACGLVSKGMRSKVIYCVELVKAVAGTHYRGEFETKVFGLISEAVRNVNLVMFIDEVHSLVGAGEAEGAVDASTLFKPYMSRGKIAVIGASTFREFDASVGRDPALERRFRPLEVEEFSMVLTHDLIMSLAGVYENYYGVIYSFDVLECVVTSSVKYLTTRRLPDKALDLFDESGSTRSIRKPAAVKVRAVNKLERRDDKIKARFWDYGEDMEFLVRSLDEVDLPFILAQFRFVLEVPLKTRAIQTALRQNRLVFLDEVEPNTFLTKSWVTMVELLGVISHWTGVKRQGTSRQQGVEMLERVEDVLSTRVVGQYAAVSAIGRALRRARANVRPSSRPVASFMFCGPTGVGKTEVVKALSFFFYGSEEKMVRIDMGEYSEKEYVSKLIGPGPAYVGADVPGVLSGPMQSDSRRVVLFDEIEKCVYEVRCLLLQILEEAQIRDGHGRICDFKRAMIIATSNVGSLLILLYQQESGAKSHKKKEDLQTVVKGALRSEFAPEFLNRFDEIVIFNPISVQTLAVIRGVLFRQIQERVGVLEVLCQLTKPSHMVMCDLGYSVTMGVRPMKRMFSEVFDYVLAWSSVVEALSGRHEGHLFIDVGFVSREAHTVRLINPTQSGKMRDYGGYKIRRSLRY